MFDRLAPAIAAFFMATLSMSAIFGAVVLSGGSPVRPEFYGPTVYEIPAMLWVSVQASTAILAIFGAVFRWRVIGALGAFTQALLFLFFGGAAVSAGAAGTLLVAMALPSSALCGLAGWVMVNGK